MNDVTRILQSIEQGDPKAAEELLPLVYEELRKLAAYRMANEAPGQTLQPTALVHEAWLKLVGADQKWENRRHFFAAAAEAMRRILVEKARRKQRARHGGGLLRVEAEAIEMMQCGSTSISLWIQVRLTRGSSSTNAKKRLKAVGLAST